MTTLIKNVRFKSTDKKADGCVVCEDGRIVEISPKKMPKCSDVIDGEGGILYGGLCDIHTHGAKCIDFTEASVDEIVSLENWYAQCGVTTLFPTTMTAEKKLILQAVKNIKEASLRTQKIEIAGVHIEGPFLCYERRGAHNENLLINPDIEFTKELIEASKGLKLRITVAPELEGAKEFISFCTKNNIEITLGHSVASFENCLEAIECGANCITHTFNGMNPLHHRNPGVLGTALAEDVYAELICDGLHVDKTVVKLFSKAKGSKRAVLVTDSVTLCGCPEGTSIADAGGMEIKVIDGKIINTAANCLAGSSLKLCEGVKNYMNFAGVSLDAAMKCAAENPRRCVGIYGKNNMIKPSGFADFVITDDNANLKKTIFRGKVTFEN